MNRVEVALKGIRAPRWRADVARRCRRALAAAGFDGWDLSVLLTSDAVIRELNGRYRGRDRATDVLSFSQTEGARVARRLPGTAIGDIVISVETLRRNAAERGLGDLDELTRLLVHGILHLSGMDHGRGTGRAMRERERRIVADLGSDAARRTGGGKP